MWDCPECGCRSIAASLTTCPMCGRERDMPRSTVNSGGSNANAVEGETGYVPPVAADVPEVPEAAGNVAVMVADKPAEPAADAEVPETPKGTETVSEPQPKLAPKPLKAD